MARKAGAQSVQGLKRMLRELPLSLAHDVALRASPEMSRLTRTAYDSNQNVYGDPRPVSLVTGNALDLYRTGALAAGLRFKTEGTIIRCVLGPKYAKYMIGKYGVLPNGPLPAGWSRKLGEIVASAKAPL